VHGENRQRRFQPFRELEGNRKGDTELALRGLNHALGFPCDNMATLGHFIFTGVLERFPKLRLAILESNSGWLPFWLGRMDDHTHGRNSVMGKSENLKLRPTEYFMRQCIVSCDSDEHALKHVVEELNGENIVWNTDYPIPMPSNQNAPCPISMPNRSQVKPNEKFSGTTPSNFTARESPPESATGVNEESTAKNIVRRSRSQIERMAAKSASGAKMKSDC